MPFNDYKLAFTGESGGASFSRTCSTLVGHCLAVLRFGWSLELHGKLLRHCRALLRRRVELSGL